MIPCGLLGGTFDPIHCGHLILAESARETFGLEKVIFVPAARPPHKPGQVTAPARDRLRLVEMAVADNPYFAVDDLELRRPGPSYTVDTVAALSAEHPGRAWSLIVGSDALAEIPTWHRFADLLDSVAVLAALRPGSPLVVPDALRPWAARIHAFAPPALDISSTAIRDRLRRGLSVRYLVPAEVGRYLEASGLYRPGGRV